MEQTRVVTQLRNCQDSKGTISEVFGQKCFLLSGRESLELTTATFFASFCTMSSFSTLVVFLKVLLNQQGLDKPFTGGLGSYALYVLVASHVSIDRL